MATIIGMGVPSKNAPAIPIMTVAVMNCSAPISADVVVP